MFDAPDLFPHVYAVGVWGRPGTLWVPLDRKIVV
jgi:hypothetical protein